MEGGGGGARGPLRGAPAGGEVVQVVIGAVIYLLT